jgi:hypothetical protein
VADQDDALKSWGDFFLSTAGGIGLGAVLWFAFKQPCPLGDSELTLDCVSIGAADYGRQEFLFGASILAVLLGITIHALRK